MIQDSQLVLISSLILIAFGFLAGFLYQKWKQQIAARQNSFGVSHVPYETIIDNLPEAVAVVDPEGIILAVNPLFLRLMREQDENQVVGQPISRIMPDVALQLQQGEDHSPGDDDILMEGRYVEVISSQLVSDNERLHGQIVVLRDSTIRHQIEIALQANERRYRSLFENSNDAIFIITARPDYRIVTANLQAAILLRAELGKLLQKDIMTFIPKRLHSFFADFIDQLIAGETISLYESEFLCDDGSLVAVEISLTLVRDGDGNPHQIQMITRDITERKEAEQIMQNRLFEFAILREVDDEVSRSLDVASVRKVSLEAAMRLSQADAGCIAITHGDEVIIEEIAGAFTPHHVGKRLTRDYGIVGSVMETHRSERVLDVQADERYRVDVPGMRALIAIPMVVKDRLLGIIGLETKNPDHFSENVYQLLQLMMNRVAVALENARLYDHVSKQVGELRQAEELRNDMIRIANHDLKNPLSLVRGYLDLLQLDQADLPDQYAMFFQEMQQGLTRMFGILDDFLSVEAITQRATGAMMMRLDLRDLVVRACDEYEPQAQARKLKFKRELIDPEIAYIVGDESQLYEAVTNLISNAIKYTPEGGEIRIRLSLTNSDHVSYEVIDTGYGVPADRQEGLFRPFYRSKTEETATIEGTGLGLHLVKNIIDRHNGEMIFRSVYREGSTFGFTLPILTLS